MKYYIYRNPDFNKIGCTMNPLKRMEEQQGLAPWTEYVIAEADNEITASHLEAYYKGFYRAKWDKDIYMSITEKTIFTKSKSERYFNINDVSSYDFGDVVYDGVTFNDGGQITQFSADEASYLDTVVQSSQFNSGCYIVPKALYALRERLDEKRMDIIGQNGNTGEHYESERSENNNKQIPEFQQIRDWAEDKGIFASGDPKTQYIKLQEEAGEVAKALLNDDKPEIIDGLGDCLVVLINLATLCGYNLEDCLAEAYNVIKKRTGKMVDGTFIKDE